MGEIEKSIAAAERQRQIEYGIRDFRLSIESVIAGIPTKPCSFEFAVGGTTIYVKLATHPIRSV